MLPLEAFIDKFLLSEGEIKYWLSDKIYTKSSQLCIYRKVRTKLPITENHIIV